MNVSQSMLGSSSIIPSNAGCPTVSVTIHLLAKVTVLFSLQSSWVLLI